MINIINCSFGAMFSSKLSKIESAISADPKDGLQFVGLVRKNNLLTITGMARSDSSEYEMMNNHIE